LSAGSGLEELGCGLAFDGGIFCAAHFGKRRIKEKDNAHNAKHLPMVLDFSAPPKPDRAESAIYLR
jgi:hypothetical protein